MKLVIITGINRGLGESLFNHLINEEHIVILAISRRLNEFQEHLLTKKAFIYHKLNLSTTISVDFLDDLDLSSYTEIHFINNAASISPIKRIGKFTNKEIIDITNLNFNSPFLIINKLIGYNINKLVITNISSGAANHAIEGWALYCSTKAAIQMITEVLKQQEVNNPKIIVNNIDPGVMDTGMQNTIRDSNINDMPSVSRFKDLKSANKLATPCDVALDILVKNALL